MSLSLSAKLRKAHRDPVAEIHPDTAQLHGIKNHDWLWIETRRGRIRQRARLTTGIDPRVIAIEHGWWFPEEPAPGYGVWKSNPNLLPSLRDGPRSGGVWGTAVRHGHFGDRNVEPGSTLV